MLFATVAYGIATCDYFMFTCMADVIAMCLSGRCYKPLTDALCWQMLLPSGRWKSHWRVAHLCIWKPDCYWPVFADGKVTTGHLTSIYSDLAHCNAEQKPSTLIHNMLAERSTTFEKSTEDFYLCHLGSQQDTNEIQEPRYHPSSNQENQYKQPEEVPHCGSIL